MNQKQSSLSLISNNTMNYITDKLSKEKTNILVVPTKEEHTFFKLISDSDYLYDVKFIPMSELIKDFLGYYDEEALDIIKNNFEITYDGAEEYLNSFLITDSIYKELVKDYYHYNPAKIEYYKDKNLVIFVGFNFNTLIFKTFLEIEKIGIKIDYLQANKLKEEELNHKFIEYPNIVLEVEGLAENISELLDKGVNPDSIFVEISDPKYINLIDDIFPFYNIEYSYDEIIPISSLEDTNKLIKFFREQTNLLTIDSFKKFYELYEIDPKNKEAIENIFKGHHRIKEEFFEYLLSKVYIRSEKYKNCIKIGSFNDRLFNEDEYLFVLGANQGSFPSPYKESGLLTDETLQYLGLKTEEQINTFRESFLCKRFPAIKNVVVSYKLKDDTKDYIKASIIDKLNNYQEPLKMVYSNDRYSMKRDIIKYFKSLDIKEKYGIENEDYKNFYMLGEEKKNLRNSFSNDLVFDNENRVKEYLKNTLKMSNSSLNNYLSCPFKYFASNILNLNPFDTTYDSYLGNFFHKVIERFIDKEYDQSEVDILYEEYRDENKDKGFELSIIEQYFFKKFYENISEIVKIIKGYYDSLSVNKTYKEKRLLVKEKHNDFTVYKKGFSDLILEDDSNHVLIFDYKTGNPPSWKTEEGEGLQLLIYFNLYNTMNKLDKKLFGIFYICIDKKAKKEDKKVSIKSRFLGYEDLINNINPSRSITEKRNAISKDEMDKMLEVAEKYLDDTIDEILNNNFKANPKKDNSCYNCGFKDICYKTFTIEDEMEEDE
ncbi:PD-(D/E)XK nuclease family protein [bacterium]|nr:PD-(D/E)XK nuclease family protein [bacterium]